MRRMGFWAGGEGRGGDGEGAGGVVKKTTD